MEQKLEEVEVKTTVKFTSFLEADGRPEALPKGRGGGVGGWVLWITAPLRPVWEGCPRTCPGRLALRWLRAM